MGVTLGSGQTPLQSVVCAVPHVALVHAVFAPGRSGAAWHVPSHCTIPALHSPFDAHALPASGTHFGASLALSPGSPESTSESTGPSVSSTVPPVSMAQLAITQPAANDASAPS